MATLTIRLSDFDEAFLNDLAKSTGETKTALVLRSLRMLASSIREDERVTRLSLEEFENFLTQLEEGEKDPKVLAARARFRARKPVWED
ncbi:DUF1778 domain-containing protein [Sutterella sp.]|uniref:type II toxin -antitoxin system TacA 1-like antitoxin n=1 Tax=Sutterella sp. TaxID=1981025 RepID=UPI0026E0567A|nr:DUF1778 domain-containing protein [Sutterella sp.]MDO5532487.1 DUF1778 domain-containing protein [Sutterella sp.]